ncbi:hypothetical protein N431DRAFT_435624 [Stipitochalara longipes BDJ]|nr:hypothetical protein N431DRAFT_435624 [Stipitochalara longipes BDJ]
MLEERDEQSKFTPQRRIQYHYGKAIKGNKSPWQGLQASAQRAQFNSKPAQIKEQTPRTTNKFLPPTLSNSHQIIFTTLSPISHTQPTPHLNPKNVHLHMVPHAPPPLKILHPFHLSAPASKPPTPQRSLYKQFICPHPSCLEYGTFDLARDMRAHLQEVHGCTLQNGCYARNIRSKEVELVIKGEEGMVWDEVEVDDEKGKGKEGKKTPEEWRAWMKANP